MRAFLIDPDKREITEIQTSGTLGEMHRLLSRPGCRPNDDINAVGISPQRDTLWVDGEGLLKENVPIFRLRGYPRPLAGRGLVLGCDEAGSNTDASPMLGGVLRAVVEWTDLLTTGRLTPMIQAPHFIKIGDGILKGPIHGERGNA